MGTVGYSPQNAIIVVEPHCCQLEMEGHNLGTTKAVVCEEQAAPKAALPKDLSCKTRKHWKSSAKEWKIKAQSLQREVQQLRKDNEVSMDTGWSKAM